MRCCATITTKIPLSLVLSALARSDQLLRARRFFNLQESGINCSEFVGNCLWRGACGHKRRNEQKILIFFGISVIPSFQFQHVWPFSGTKMFFFWNSRASRSKVPISNLLAGLNVSFRRAEVISNIQPRSKNQQRRIFGFPRKAKCSYDCEYLLIWWVGVGKL